MAKATRGRKIYLPYIATSLLIIKEVRTGTQTGQEPGADLHRPWRGVAYWIAIRGLLSLFLL